jgi:hypothetical protein
MTVGEPRVGAEPDAAVRGPHEGLDEIGTPTLLGDPERQEPEKTSTGSVSKNSPTKAFAAGRGGELQRGPGGSALLPKPGHLSPGNRAGEGVASMQEVKDLAPEGEEIWQKHDWKT